MTYEEALNHLQFKYETSKNEAYKIAIEALEKQVPKKPFIHHADDDNWYTCENCDSEVNSYNNYYCSCCGQKIDWSEVE